MNQVSILKINIPKLSDENKDFFIENLKRTLDHINTNYVLIERHNILLKSLSKITLELISVEYSTIPQIKNDIKNNPTIVNLISLTNESYSELIRKLDGLSFGNINIDYHKTISANIKQYEQKLYDVIKANY